MKEALQTALITAVHYVIAFIVCLCISMSGAVPRELLEHFSFAYRLDTGIMYFISVLPALHIAGLLVGYSWVFRPQKSVRIGRWSPVFLKYVKGFLVLTLCALTVIVVCTELVNPSVVRARKNMYYSSADYEGYVALAEKDMAEGEFSSALFYADQALRIWPLSPEAAELKRTAELEYAAAETDTQEPAVSVPPVLSEDSVAAELRRARAAYEAHDYFDAHYYAQNAARSASSRDPNGVKARELAADAWNKLYDVYVSPQSAAEYDIFSKKRDGYTAIQNGEYLHAYYIFKDLEERLTSVSGNMSDPDVKRYLALAKENLEKVYFFTDETDNVRQFESSKNILFSLGRSDGGKDILYAEGITFFSDAGMSVQYLRNFSCVRFDSGGMWLGSFSVPYAKMTEISAGLLPESVSGGYATVPQILLYSVDRSRENETVYPEYTYPSGSAENVFDTGSLFVLPMPFSDFPLILSAADGVDVMPLFSLWRFARRADSYGYSSAVYLQALIGRLAFPFIILILSVFAVMAGWRYRVVDGRPFRFVWFILAPIFSAACFFVLQVVLYISRLCIFVFIGLSPSFALPVTLAFLVVFFVLAMISFVSQRGD